MHNSGNVAQECKKNINPKVQAKTDLEKYADRGENYCENYSDYIHFYSYFRYLFLDFSLQQQKLDLIQSSKVFQ